MLGQTGPYGLSSCNFVCKLPESRSQGLHIVSVSDHTTKPTITMTVMMNTFLKFMIPIIDNTKF